LTGSAFTTTLAIQNEHYRLDNNAFPLLHPRLDKTNPNPPRS
jgi:hypothetical protein